MLIEGAVREVHGLGGPSRLWAQAVEAVRDWRSIPDPRLKTHQRSWARVWLIDAKVSYPCPSPVTDAVVLLASAITGKQYRETGLNVAKLGFQGLDAKQVRRLVEQGHV